MMGLVTAFSAGALGAVGIVEARFRIALLLLGSVLTGWLAMWHGSPLVSTYSQRRKKANFGESAFS